MSHDVNARLAEIEAQLRQLKASLNEVSPATLLRQSSQLEREVQRFSRRLDEIRERISIVEELAASVREVDFEFREYRKTQKESALFAQELRKMAGNIRSGPSAEHLSTVVDMLANYFESLLTSPEQPSQFEEAKLDPRDGIK